MSRPSFIPDNFVLGLIFMVVFATFLPADGKAASALKLVSSLAIAALFFLHGARLSRVAIVAGLTHWRLQLLIMVGTFAIFPALVLGLRSVFEPLIGSPLYLGLIFLSVVPSTVQSTIALTSMARGNVPAAVCSASASTLMGIFLTPMLVGWLMAVDSTSAADFGWTAVGRIVLQLFVPFFVGHLLQRWIGGWVRARAKMLKVVDQGSILLVVYTAFSAAVISGIWRQLSWESLVVLLAVCAVLLVLVLGSMAFLARRLGFSKEDEITIVLCGANKSLASGVPMANVLFPASAAGPIVLPLMLFHQLQLMLCSFLAARWSGRRESTGSEARASST